MDVCAYDVCVLYTYIRKYVHAAIGHVIVVGSSHSHHRYRLPDLLWASQAPGRDSAYPGWAPPLGLIHGSFPTLPAYGMGIPWDPMGLDVWARLLVTTLDLFSANSSSSFSFNSLELFKVATCLGTLGILPSVDRSAYWRRSGSPFDHRGEVSPCLLLPLTPGQYTHSSTLVISSTKYWVHASTRRH
jgi:hypothetical protein